MMIHRRSKVLNIGVGGRDQNIGGPRWLGGGGGANLLLAVK